MKSILNIAVSCALVGLFFVMGAYVKLIAQISVLLLMAINGPDLLGKRFEALMDVKGVPPFFDRRIVQIITLFGALSVMLIVITLS